MWPALVMYSSEKGIVFKLTERKRELIQCYSILVALKEAIVCCQSDGVSVNGYMAFLELISMAVSRNGLEIVDTFEMKGARVGNPASPTIVEHDKLLPVAKELQEKLIQSLYTCFYIRYSPCADVQSSNCSYEFDTAALFYPPNNNGAMAKEYVRSVWEMTNGEDSEESSLDAHCSEILERCWNRIRLLGEKHCKEVRRTEAENDVGESASVFMNKQTEEAASEAASELSASQSSSTSNGNLFVSNPGLTKRFRLRMSTNPTEATSLDETNRLTPKQAVNAEIKLYQDQKFDFEGCNPVLTLEWWENRKEQFPILSRVASAVLSQQSSAGGFERDFLPASNTLTGLRNSLSPENVEMILCGKLNYGSIPEFVPTLNPIELKATIPDVACGIDLDSFTFAPNVDSDSDSDASMAG